MQDSGADLLENKPAGVPQIGKEEKPFNPVTNGELVKFFTYTAEKGGWTDEARARLKKEDPNTYAEFQSINERRNQELDSLKLPSNLVLLEERSGKFERDRGGVMDYAPSLELEERLQKVEMWQKKWGGSEVEKLALYRRLKQLEAFRPEGVTEVPDEEEAKNNIGDMESESQRIIQELNERIKSRKRAEFQQLFDQKGHGGLGVLLPEPYFGEERPEDQETWAQLKNGRPNEYEVKRRLYEQYANELRSIEPPISLDYYSVSVKGPDLKGLDTPKLQDLSQRTKTALEDWNKLSDEEKKARLGRIAVLRNTDRFHRSDLGKYDTRPEHSFENFEVDWWSGALERQSSHLKEELERRNSEEQKAKDQARAVMEETKQTYKDVLEDALKKDSPLNQRTQPVVEKRKKRFGIF
ncbi:MAG: hypothetical protein HYT07_04205 [Candidatus Levybacteria bacterium]|nr:hypothetical protein [Candidatus Levybacteria bacterium]